MKKFLRFLRKTAASFCMALCAVAGWLFSLVTIRDDEIIGKD